MHSSRRRRTVVTAVSAVPPALPAARCGSGDSGPGDATEADGHGVLLQPVAAPGPDPFTRSTAKATAPLPTTDDPAPTHTESASPSARGVRRVSGRTPGLHGGARPVSTCDAEQRIHRLTGPGADPAKARAFAGAGRVGADAVPRFPRGPAPVVPRADTPAAPGFRTSGTPANPRSETTGDSGPPVAPPPAPRPARTPRASVPSGCPVPGDHPALRPPSAPGTAPERDTGTESGPDGG
ncbi:DUF6777 domain-containing protein [Streptomyces sp. NPDC088745]|uniref:DUF6777 domain-containing protein n=1 Tax=Streptomyces sp. NPDC088745 TaxID=3365884 RepID=UPI0037FBC58A